MNTYKILFAVGRDRTGIVDEVSTYLFERGANIEDSRMASLGGRFSIMCLFSASDEEIARIESELPGLNDRGMQTFLHDADDPASVPARGCLPLHLEVLSMDHPGIVQNIVKILTDHEVNITALDTSVTSMPHSGAPLFDLNLSGEVPCSVTIGELKEKLKDLAFDSNLDLNFRN